MTNDDLNRWYHEHLGKCVQHQWKEHRDGPVKYKCELCTEVSVLDSRGFLSKGFPVRNYLSDPTVILGIIKEHELIVKRDHGRGNNGEWIARGDETYDWAIEDTFERAVMLALKAKVEQKEKAVA